MARMLTQEERDAYRAKFPKPANDIFWEQYLTGHHARTDRVGEMIVFSRYGDLPDTGRSKVWKTFRDYQSYPELKGVSVFEVVNGFEIYPVCYSNDLFTRPRFIGAGIIVGWGTDGEPLVEILCINREPGIE